jgi:hypothetical protein
MLARYRVVILVYILAFLFAGLATNLFHVSRPFDAERFWNVWFFIGTGISGFWLLLCWVVCPPSRSSL